MQKKQISSSIFFGSNSWHQQCGNVFCFFLNSWLNCFSSPISVIRVLHDSFICILIKKILGKFQSAAQHFLFISYLSLLLCFCFGFFCSEQSVTLLLLLLLLLLGVPQVSSPRPKSRVSPTLPISVFNYSKGLTTG